MSKRAPYPSLTAAQDSAPEFPKGHVDTPPTDEAVYLGRRGLLGAMAATMALVGAEGCRRPVEKVVPYTRMPEDVIPGVPAHYATVLQRRGDAVGLVVESHEARPTKIEGNESHPASLGAADLVTQATILDLYDPERSTIPRKSGEAASWDDFEREFGARLAHHAGDQGTRLRVLMQPTISPTTIRMRAELAQRFPKARVHTWSAVSDSNVHEGVRIAIGQRANPLYSYDRARIIVSLDADFLQTESGAVVASKHFAAGRRMRSSRDAMNRLYVVEPSRTTTGGNADHRLRLPAAGIEGYACALALELGKANQDVGGGLALGELETVVRKSARADRIPPKWLSAVARELLSNRRKSILVAGSRQPATVHALVHALNGLLGNFGSTVSYAPVADPDEIDSTMDVKDLADAMGAGRVESLVVLGGNPVYDAPADLAFGDVLRKVPFSAHLSLYFDETSSACTWHLPQAHDYESWGDASSLDGSVALQQPLLSPLYGGRSAIELLGWMANAPDQNAYEAVRATARETILAGHHLSGCAPFNELGKADCQNSEGKPARALMSDIEREWARALAVGVLRRGQPALGTPAVRMGDVAAAIGRLAPPASEAPGTLEVTFAPCPKMVDGRHANNTWLQEMPDPVTKLVWDNAAIVSPATARELGVANKDMLKIVADDRSIVAAAWIVPGQADRSIALTLGWGRTKVGRIGNGRGFDAYPLRTTGSMGFVVGVHVTKTGDPPYFFAQTQEHDSAEGRPIALEATLEDYRNRPNFPELDAPPPRSLPLWSQQDYSAGHQWGMSIDLNACTGCNACVIACMSENNVPVVGKREVWRGRSMHWLRIDRYYVENAAVGASADDPLVANQPVMCVHCEEAPCENVCPVNATTHGPEGLNEMAYNRCIGTRYCANNCPYKVRKFNYLNWHNDSVWKETGGLPETMQMQQNPNVTVRFRGVMEKCTYCVQRIQSAKIRSKRENRSLRDGEIRSACQQTCPADAIVFGDLNDPHSAVTRWSRTDRRYGLLADLGTRPRTTHLGKIRNPNPEMGA